MSERELLPLRRPRTSIEFVHHGQTFIGGAGYWVSGRIGEVFLSASKPNSQRDIDTKDAAIAASLALQHGCEIQTLQKAMLRDDAGNAAGPLGHLLDLLVEMHP